MSDRPPEPPEESLTEEFRILGKNLVQALQTAWESPERKRLQAEIETGLNELGQTIRNEAETLRESPTGQRIQDDVQNIKESVRTGEAETKMRAELLSALQVLNRELEKVAARFGVGGTQEPAAPPAPPSPEPPQPPEAHR